MDIITLMTDVVEELFEAGQKFMEEPENFAKLEASADEISRKMAVKFIRMTLEETDELIRKSLLRKEGYDIQRKKKRSLITTVGDVTYERTLFNAKDTGKTKALLDVIMELPPHERLSVLAEAKILYESQVHSYKHAADSLAIGDQTITKTTVMEKVHNISKILPESTSSEEKFKDESEKKWVDYLYFEADEDHIHRQKCGEEKGSMIGKLVYVFEGKEDLCKGRRKLIQPCYKGGLYAGSEGNRQLWEEVQAYIEANYNSDALKCVYINSDGGAWIRAGKDYVDKSVLVADRFHLMKYINRVSRYALSDEETTKQRFYKYIYKNNLLSVKKLLTRIKNCSWHDEVIEDTRRYFINNWDAIQRAFHDKNVYGCSAEGHVSHIFSERMSSRPMGWSEEGSDGMMKLRCYVRNHGKEKIIDLVEYRRKRKLENTKATGTDGMIEADVPKKYISAERRRTLSYVERLQARIPGYTAKKALAIRERLQGI